MAKLWLNNPIVVVHVVTRGGMTRATCDTTGLRRNRLGALAQTRAMT